VFAPTSAPLAREVKPSVFLCHCMPVLPDKLSECWSREWRWAHDVSRTGRVDLYCRIKSRGPSDPSERIGPSPIVKDEKDEVWRMRRRKVAGVAIWVILNHHISRIRRKKSVSDTPARKPCAEVASVGNEHKLVIREPMSPEWLRRQVLLHEYPRNISVLQKKWSDWQQFDASIRELLTHLGPVPRPIQVSTRPGSASVAHRLGVLSVQSQERRNGVRRRHSRRMFNG
jgi:hypothetical protein